MVWFLTRLKRRNDQDWSDDYYEGDEEYGDDYDDVAGIGDIDDLADITPYAQRIRRAAAPLGPPPPPPPGIGVVVRRRRRS